MDRTEHLNWAKHRAIEYLDLGDRQNAISSLVSDLNKHPTTSGHPGIELMMMLLLSGQLSSDRELRTFLEGFA